MPPLARLVCLALSALPVTIAGGLACSSTGAGAGGGTASSNATSVSSSSAIASSSSSGTGGACGSAPLEVFGVCDGAKAVDGGSSPPGAACATATDCAPVCCPCPEGQTDYAYATCSCGRCTSVCNPVNDTRAPVCADGGVVTTGCWACSQILNAAFAEGEQLGGLACAGAASTTWNAVEACSNGPCGAVCDGGVMPDDPCVVCLEGATDAGGCADQIAACNGH